jgi:hypothetical protein
MNASLMIVFVAWLELARNEWWRQGDRMRGDVVRARRYRHARRCNKAVAMDQT